MTTATGKAGIGDYDTGRRCRIVDSRIYTEHGLFEEEIEKIWKRSGSPASTNPSCRTRSISAP